MKMKLKKNKYPKNAIRNSDIQRMKCLIAIAENRNKGTFITYYKGYLKAMEDYKEEFDRDCNDPISKIIKKFWRS